jgi:hypothetical protein
MRQLVSSNIQTLGVFLVLSVVSGSWLRGVIAGSQDVGLGPEFKNSGEAGADALGLRPCGEALPASEVGELGGLGVSAQEGRGVRNDHGVDLRFESVNAVREFFVCHLDSLWWTYKDEPWWRQLSEDERKGNLFVPIPGLPVMKFPTAFDIDNLFMALPVAIADSWYAHEPERMKAWFNNFLEESTVAFSLDNAAIGIKGIGLSGNALLPILLETMQQLANRISILARLSCPKTGKAA